MMGVAPHRVDKETLGHDAWQALVTWYDGPTAVGDSEATYRTALNNTYLTPGTDAFDFINRFLHNYNALNKLKYGDGMSEQSAKALLIKNIHDPSFQHIKDTLYMADHQTPFSIFIDKIRRWEHKLMAERKNKKEIRRISTLLGPNETDKTQPASKRQRAERKNNTPGTGSLGKVVHPNLKGIIHIQPSMIWHALQPEHQKWVLSYNAAVRHNEELPSPPSGVTIGKPFNDGEGNHDKSGSNARRPRQVPSPSTTT
jgi:hypothetical protein